MEEVLDLLPLADDPASLLWLESEVLNLDLFNVPLFGIEDDASSASSLTTSSTDSQTETDDSSSIDDLRVVIRFNKTTTGAKAVAKAPVGRASHRQRQKQDMQLLRAHVADLQNELRFLQRAKQEPSGSSTQSEVSRKDGSEWQLIAKQQFQARELAEQENRVLRQTLQERIRMAKSLERVLLQHEMIRTIPKPYCPRNIPRDHFTTNTKSGPWNSDWIAVNTFQDADVRVFHELLAHVEQSAGDLNAVFKSNGLDRITTNFSDARLKISPTIEPTGLPAMAIEMRDVKVIPFGLEQTERVVWRCVSSKRVPISRTTGIPWQKYAGLAESDDIVALRSDEVEVLLHRVMKKFVDPESGLISFVWESQLKLKESGSRLRQRGWVQFERQPAAERPTTLVRSCLYVDPVSDFNDPNTSEIVRTQQREHFATIADRILPHFEKTVSTTYKTIETLLIEESQATTARDPLDRGEPLECCYVSHDITMGTVALEFSQQLR